MKKSLTSINAAIAFKSCKGEKTLGQITDIAELLDTYDYSEEAFRSNQHESKPFCDSSNASNQAHPTLHC
jgi:hypothetical protein